MALGYCMICDELRTIRPGPQKWGSRECAWYPTPHYNQIHITCKALVDQYYGEDNYCCRACGQVPANEVIVERCPGETKEIK